MLSEIRDTMGPVGSWCGGGGGKTLARALEVNRGLADSAFPTGPWKLRSWVTRGRNWEPFLSPKIFEEMWKDDDLRQALRKLKAGWTWSWSLSQRDRVTFYPLTQG